MRLRAPLLALVVLPQGALAAAGAADRAGPRAAGPHRLGLLHARGVDGGGIDVSSITEEGQAAVLRGVAAAQLQLLERLAAMARDLNATAARVQADARAANENAAVVLDMERRVPEAVAVVEAYAQGMQSGAARQLRGSAAELGAKLPGLNATVGQIRHNLAAFGLADAIEKQSVEDLRALRLVKPRFVRMDRKLDSVEAVLFPGNLSGMVEDTVDRQTMSIIADMGRGLARELRS